MQRSQKPLLALVAALGLAAVTVLVAGRGSSSQDGGAAAPPGGLTPNHPEPHDEQEERRPEVRARLLVPEEIAQLTAEPARQPVHLASGVVLGPAGQPVSGATVYAELFAAKPDLSGRSAWQRAGATARTDSEGGFTLHGTIDSDELAVLAAHPGFATAQRVECAVGATTR